MISSTQAYSRPTEQNQFEKTPAFQPNQKLAVIPLLLGAAALTAADWVAISAIIVGGAGTIKENLTPGFAYKQLQNAKSFVSNLLSGKADNSAQARQVAAVIAKNNAVMSGLTEVEKSHIKQVLSIPQVLQNRSDKPRADRKPVLIPAAAKAILTCAPKPEWGQRPHFSVKNSTDEWLEFMGQEIPGFQKKIDAVKSKEGCNFYNKFVDYQWEMMKNSPKMSYEKIIEKFIEFLYRRL